MGTAKQKRAEAKEAKAARHSRTKRIMLIHRTGAIREDAEVHFNTDPSSSQIWTPYAPWWHHRWHALERRRKRATVTGSETKDG